MKVLFATAELTPLARVGGLAEAAAGLVRALRADGTEVHVVIPDYGDVELEGQETTTVDVAPWIGPVTLRSGRHATAGDITLVGTPVTSRPHPYVDARGEGWPDNDERFFGFSAVVAWLAGRTRPDVVHLNDWHTAAATAFLKAPRPPVVLTIHTLGYQGVTTDRWLDRLGPEADRFRWFGGTNPMAGAISLADRVIAVSPNYAAEILTEAHGMGLHEHLLALGDRLVGIRNGIDVATWNPATDPHLAEKFSSDEREGRQACQAALRREAGWSDVEVPIIAVVSRLVEQKGIDLLLDAARFLPTMPARLAVLGAGEEDLAAGLTRLADDQPGRVWFHDGYDEPLAHRLFAGSDLFAMPSRFEPCGLAQMQAMAYGSLPVVTDVGGLHDTVIDGDRDRSHGTGFVATAPDAPSLVDALHRGLRAVRHSGRRTALQTRAMSHDWSWRGPAQRHIEVYRDVIDG